MKLLKRIVAAILLSVSIMGCTAIGVGVGATVGAVAGTGGAVSIVGGALIGGVSETPAEERVTEGNKLH